jgi:hypothetical protein
MGRAVYAVGVMKPVTPQRTWDCRLRGAPDKNTHTQRPRTIANDSSEGLTTPHGLSEEVKVTTFGSADVMDSEQSSPIQL